jgi:hypothetical protein
MEQKEFFLLMLNHHQGAKHMLDDNVHDMGFQLMNQHNQGHYDVNYLM